MQDVTSFTARSTRARNGWSKIGIVISLLIVAAAGVTLFHLLGDIDLTELGYACSEHVPTANATHAVLTRRN